MATESTWLLVRGRPGPYHVDEETLRVFAASAAYLAAHPLGPTRDDDEIEDESEGE